MKLQHKLGLIIVFLSFAGALTGGSPLWKIRDDLDLFFDGSATVRYQSNLFWDDTRMLSYKRDAAGNVISPLTPYLQDKKIESDVIWIFSPGFELRYGQPGAEGKARIICREDFYFFTHNSNLNTKTANLLATASFQNPKINFYSHAKWYQLYSNDAITHEQGVILKRERTDLGARIEDNFTEKTTGGLGLQFYYEHFPEPDPRSRDSYIVELPLDLYYNYSPKLAASIGYQWRYTDLTDDKRKDVIMDYKNGQTRYWISDAMDHFFNVGLRGVLAPKLDTQIKIGYGIREFERSYLGSIGGLSLKADFNWEATSKITVRQTIYRDYKNTSSGSSTTDFGGELSVQYAFSPRLSGNTALGYTHSNYDTGVDSSRVDNTYIANLSLSYNISNYWRITASYTYQNNDSRQDKDGNGNPMPFHFSGQSYENHMINLTAALRY